ncbi:MAG TPA: restriction endonuclease subunit S [Candidatus Competibacter sp.]|nr:restriction endonuclease subunit S [Candidatus Competibacter sp.]HRW64732.1 restriction endonuclease subunit S [Candidatus Competibacter sp.]
MDSSMMEVSNRYGSYQKGKHPWLDQIPSHWLEKRAKVSFREVDEKSAEGNEELLSVSHMTGVTPRSQKNVTMFKAASYAGHKLCRPGDIVINTMWAWMGALGESHHTGIVSPAYGVYRLHREGTFAPGYLDYLLRTRAYISEYICQSTGIRSSRLRLYPDKFLRIPLLQPPLEEQHSIVSYLHAQDRQIAKLIRSKRRLIELLNEQKQTTIHRAVTRGLNLDVPLKPSGIDWLGDVPAHWSLLSLKNLARLRSGDSITSFQIEESGEFPVYGGNGLRGYTNSYTHQGEYVLIGRQGALCGNINYANGKFWASEHAVVANPLTKYNLRWFGEVLRAMNLNQYSQSAAQPGLAVERIKNLCAPVPPIDEQDTIVRFFETETASLDITINATEHEIALIREYRDRLISDVVTGQIDVRGWQPANPIPEDEESIDTLVNNEDDSEIGEDDADDEHP